MHKHDQYYESFHLEKHLRHLISCHYRRIAEEIEAFPNEALDEDTLNKYEQATKEAL